MNNPLKQVLKDCEQWEIIDLYKTLQIVFGVRDSMARYGLTAETLAEELKKHQEFSIKADDIENLFSFQLNIDLEMIAKLEAFFTFKEASLIKNKK